MTRPASSSRLQTAAGVELIDGGYVGTRATFARAGFAVVHQPTTRKLVMRIEL